MYGVPYRTVTELRTTYLHSQDSTQDSSKTPCTTVVLLVLYYLQYRYSMVLVVLVAETDSRRRNSFIPLRARRYYSMNVGLSLYIIDSNTSTCSNAKHLFHCFYFLQG